jgi:uncharacterized protein with HEPN domain
LTAPRDDRDVPRDPADACRAIMEFVEGMTLEAYPADRKTRFAVMRGFEIMGEAVRHLPEDIKKANPDVPWAMMSAVRNRVIHAYFGVDDTILFTTIGEDLAPLLPRLERLAQEHDASERR